MDLAVRHQIHRIEFIVFVKCPDDLRQILSGERFTAGKHKHTEIAAEGFGDPLDLVRFHLQLFTRAVVEFVRKKAMGTSHIADARHQNIEKHGRDRFSDQNTRVSLEDLFCCKIHFINLYGPVSGDTFARTPPPYNLR